MGASSLVPRAFWSFHICAFFFLSVSGSASAAQLRNESDRLALLAFKTEVSDDPLRLLSSWNSSLHFCSWSGVTCSRRHQRVAVLNLTSLSLKGTLSPHISNLSFLARADLSNNRFHGQIPQELGRLFRLRVLRLDDNSFEGEVPSSLSNCSNLHHLDLSSNTLSGKLPSEFGSLSRLRRLSLYRNNISGTIPPSYGNLSSLNVLSLRRNLLSREIPGELGRLKGLVFLQIAENELSGTVPSSIYNLSYIQVLSVSENKLHGGLRPDLFLGLPYLWGFYVARNQFTGPIPISLTNASYLEEVHFSTNSFSGAMPKDLGNMKSLQILNIAVNRIGNRKPGDLDFIDLLVNCTNLQYLDFQRNNFAGDFPKSIANLSTGMDWLALGDNWVSGSIPEGIVNLVRLTTFFMNNNLLTGIIPRQMGKLSMLGRLDLSMNRFLGEIPSSIGNLTELMQLYLQENNLEGSIPSSLGNCTKLLLLNMSRNNLTGIIPNQVISISSLSISLNLADNSLFGTLPWEVDRLKMLRDFDVSGNKLTGEIPQTLGNCESLTFLHLQSNIFSGTIPSSLSNLTNIMVLDLSHNNLSGQIPEFLGNFPFLQNLNLSFNDFDGKLPEGGVFTNASAVSVHGNARLCGGNPRLHLPDCDTRVYRKKGKFSLTVILLLIIVAVCLIFSPCACAVLYGRRKSRMKLASASSIEDLTIHISYSQLRKATDEFALSNLIGTGSYGSVYKGIFPSDDTTVAIKVFHLQKRGASKSFIAECEALRNIRHRNLVKILASCSSIDFKGNDFKALVYEFMPNGSLEEWLHPKEDMHHQIRYLNLIQRLNIATDMANALDYLHNHSGTPIAHCDLKPTNVLLDDNMVAHVSDFGLAKILFETGHYSSRTNSSSTAIKGTIGYVAPEYAMGCEVYTLGDVYSYGILLLELFTGRRPTDDMFNNGLSLHEYAKMAFPNGVVEIVDRKLLDDDCGGDASNKILGNRIDKKRMLDCFISVVRIGIACSMETPRERMQIKEVVTEMLVTRDKFLGVGIYKDR